MHALLLLHYAKMRTLQELALQAVPFPGKQAEKYLPAHHPIAKELQPLDYKQTRDKFREHRVKFRYVLPYITTLLRISQIAYPKKICF